MRSETLRRLLVGVPFRPFRLHLSDGTSLLVRHPDFLLLSEDRFVVTITSPNAGGDGETVSLVDPLHVTHVTLLAAAALGQRSS